MCFITKRLSVTWNMSPLVIPSSWMGFLIHICFKNQLFVNIYIYTQYVTSTIKLSSGWDLGVSSIWSLGSEIMESEFRADQMDMAIRNTVPNVRAPICQWSVQTGNCYCLNIHSTKAKRPGSVYINMPKFKTFDTGNCKQLNFSGSWKTCNLINHGGFISIQDNESKLEYVCHHLQTSSVLKS